MDGTTAVERETPRVQKLDSEAVIEFFFFFEIHLANGADLGLNPKSR